MRFAIAFTAAVAFAACNTGKGPAGPAGPAGPTGPQGPGFDAPASISDVTPHMAIIGATGDFAIAGFATEWTMAAQVSFGSGITVNRVVAASGTGLLVNITVGPNASAGKRDVTVTEGGTTTTYKNVFELKPFSSFTLKGVPSQGGIVTLQLRFNDPDFSLPTGDGQLTSELVPATGFTAIAGANDAHSFETTVGIDVDATVGARAWTVKLFPNTTRERVISVPTAFTVGLRQAVNLSAGMATATFTAPYDTALFNVDLSNEGLISSLTTIPMAAPKFVVLGAVGHYANAETPLFVPQRYLAGLNSGEVGPATSYVVLYDFTGTGGTAAVTFAPPEEVTEMEQNDTEATAQAIATPVHVTATLAEGENDWFKVTVPPEMVGHTIHYGSERGADVKVDILSGTTSLTPNGGPYDSDPENFSSTPIAAAGDLLIHVQGYSATVSGNYAFTLFFE